MKTQEFNNKLIDIKDNLKYFAFSLVSDNEKAEDLVQETFYKAISNQDKYIDNTNFKAWVFTILKNTFINNYNKAARHKTTFDNTDDDYLINSSSLAQSVSPESTYSAGEIHKAIDTLDDAYKIPFMRFSHGYKYQEIAEELDLPIGTVKSRIFFARKKLMGQLKDFR
ncbi:MAG: RNA polymerase sigma factor [Bacteroidota bacterium]|nr:RNA polymerase sigma factor [Bacteroidota bacterium]